jgi:dihydrofolate reductase
MIGAHRVEGYAIVSADGMIADAGGTIPDSLRNAADQRFLQTEMDRAAVIVHGRHSNEGGPRAVRRKRIVLTRRVAAVADDPQHPNMVLWNPAGAAFAQALAAAHVGDAGVIAILGGTEVFGLFLPLYDAFHLTRAAAVKIPQGRPVFPDVSAGVPPEDLLARQGLVAGRRRDVDAGAGISLVTWQRPQS